ncbi:hypothetical protein Cob_v005601 [Colletotrichum orbiculare MAFF 240422]|uniref:Uncharacterized protein n=1 Tax=Colletotrichum orbiculare (strain 104-T / ATCC 96160 / CBS 514.97 / LARS 414 / MAFF 240422) TaxID=1213857 RepID=A0A484FUH5_COLOR|nr:hypothetical protein Cob_v005601 [Colletotrichum orbiculare MAFF 240422]
MSMQATPVPSIEPPSATPSTPVIPSSLNRQLPVAYSGTQLLICSIRIRKLLKRLDESSSPMITTTTSESHCHASVPSQRSSKA